MKRKPLVSICIPTYNAARLIRPTLESIFSQKYSNYEIIISDDCSKDNTIQIIRELRSPQIRLYRNQKNLGYGDNLKRFKKLVRGDIIFLMAQDDFLINDGLALTVEEFIKDPKVGVVTRPYYWFGSDPTVPIRHIPAPNSKRTLVIDVKRKPSQLVPIIESVGQLSGLAYRTDLFSQFHSDVFPAHIYPFMEILRTHKCAFLPKYTIAVGTFDSQTRSKSSIYDLSPTYTWMRMFDTVFADKKLSRVRQVGKDHMAQNFVGLIQLKNFASGPKVLYKEIYLLIKYRWQNLLSPKFWFYVLGVTFVPRQVLIFLVDNYKNIVLTHKLKNKL